VIKFFKRRKQSEETSSVSEPENTYDVAQIQSSEEAGPQSSLFSRLRQSLSRTRKAFSAGLGTLILGHKEIDEALLEEIEEQLLIADIGVEATEKIIQDLTQAVSRKELNSPDVLWSKLTQDLQGLLLPCEQPLVIPKQDEPYVILMVGVNGSGKTTTIGKLAKRLQSSGYSVMLAAGDTFRAAAIEQLSVWGERNEVPVIAQQSGSDSASVIYDAYCAAKARKIDVLIADTAGRLHTQVNLMAELQKVRRVLNKLTPSAPHEVMLVLDAGIGQNALVQAKQFYAAVQVSGLTITKLDGTAKGGILFAIAQRLGLPIRFIGIGERIDDLRPFIAKDFVAALFDAEEH
jgi:fused signal recognition particle receptor